MSFWGQFRAGLSLLMTVMLSAEPTGQLCAQTVGSVGAVNLNAMGTPPNGNSRVLFLGGGVVQRERIQTDAKGTAQISFSDRSAINVGRNSTVIIDKFVYDGGSGAGQMSTSMVRGALRFVGGAVSHANQAEIQTPVASIGVRGGIVTLYIAPDGALHAINGFGQVVVRNEGGIQTITRPDYDVIVSGQNAPPKDAKLVDQVLLSKIMAMLTSDAGQTGGATTLPTDAGSARFGIGSPQPSAITPNLDLHSAADNIIRQGTTSRNQRNILPPAPSSKPPPTPGGCDADGDACDGRPEDEAVE